MLSEYFYLNNNIYLIKMAIVINDTEEQPLQFIWQNIRIILLNWIGKKKQKLLTVKSWLDKLNLILPSSSKEIRNLKYRKKVYQHHASKNLWLKRLSNFPTLINCIFFNKKKKFYNFTDLQNIAANQSPIWYHRTWKSPRDTTMQE